MADVRRAQAVVTEAPHTDTDRPCPVRSRWSSAATIAQTWPQARCRTTTGAAQYPWRLGVGPSRPHPCPAQPPGATSMGVGADPLHCTSGLPYDGRLEDARAPRRCRAA
jgi:hypothetical protein